MNLLKTLLVAMALTAVAAAPSAAQQKPPIRVGAILPMTGPLGSAGLMFRTGIDIAVEAINAQGGVNGSKIELVTEDDKLNPQESVLMFRKHAGQGVVAVLGPISSSSWENVSPLAPRLQLPAISFTFTYKEGVPNTDWSMGVSPDERTMLPEAMDEFVKLNPGVKKVVIAADIKQASGAAAIPIFQASAKKHGIQVLDVIEFETVTTDFAPIVTRTKGKNPDAVLSAGIVPSVITMLREMGSQKLDVPVFNNGMIWPGAFPQAAGPGFEKVYTVGFSTNEKLEKNPRHNAYIDAFKAKLTGNPQMPQPPNPGNSVMGHEAMYMLAGILKQKGVDGSTDVQKAREAVKQGMSETKQFQGVFDVKINQERNGYVRAHLMKVDVPAKQFVYALPEAQR
jgi:ABC-type branched-subunit amino acid transport system substrate-binding protein